MLAALEQQRNLLELQIEELAKAHASLEISHQRFAELHEHAPIGYLTFDSHGCVRDINAEAQRLLCTRRAIAIGKPFIVFVEAAERRKFLEHLWKMRRSTSTVAADLRLVARDGTVRQVRMSTNRHRAADGRAGLFLTAIEDVTELRAAGTRAALLASIVESSQDAIASFMPDGIIVSWNPGAESLFGYRAEEAIGENVSFIAPKDRRQESERLLALAVRGQRVTAFETVRQRKDGSLVDVEVSRSPILEEGRVVAIAAIWRDVSERKAAEKKIREGEERLRAVLENSLDAAYRRNLQSDGYDYVSPVIEQITGFMPEELGSKSLGDLFEWVHPSDVRHVRRTFRKAMATGEPCPRLEYRFRCKDGTFRWVAESFRVLRDAGGRPLHLVGTVRDVSERKAMEAALHESQRLARSTVEAIPAQIAVIDGAGMILDVNKAWRRFALANRGTDETTGCGVNYLEVCERVHGLERGDAKRFVAGVRSVLKGRTRMFSMDYPCHSPTERRWFTAYVTPFAGEGEVRLVIAHVNITAVKLAEEKFRDVLESAPDAMVIVSRQGTIHMLNRQAEKLFGYERRELLGRKMEMLLPADSREGNPADRARYTAKPVSHPIGGAMGAGREAQGRERVSRGGQPQPAPDGGRAAGVQRHPRHHRAEEGRGGDPHAERGARSPCRRAHRGADRDDGIPEDGNRGTAPARAGSPPHQRAGEAAHRPGPARRSRPAARRAVVFQLRAGKEPAGPIFSRGGKCREDFCDAGQGGEPDPCARPRLAAGGAGARRTDGRAPRTRRADLGTVRAPVPFCVRASGACLRSRSRHASLPDRAGGGDECRPARGCEAHRHPALRLRDGAGAVGERRRQRHADWTPGWNAGMGIRTMKYRAEAMGGSLDFRSKPKGGTKVVCTIPKTKDSAPEED